MECYMKHLLLISFPFFSVELHPLPCTQNMVLMWIMQTGSHRQIFSEQWALFPSHREKDITYTKLNIGQPSSHIFFFFFLQVVLLRHRATSQHFIRGIWDWVLSRSEGYVIPCCCFHRCYVHEMYKNIWLLLWLLIIWSVPPTLAAQGGRKNCWDAGITIGLEGPQIWFLCLKWHLVVSYIFHPFCGFCQRVPVG